MSRTNNIKQRTKVLRRTITTKVFGKSVSQAPSGIVAEMDRLLSRHDFLPRYSHGFDDIGQHNRLPPDQKHVISDSKM